MKDFLKDNSIELYSIIPLSRCKILKEYLLTKNGFGKDANVITMLFPYRSDAVLENLTVYASVLDYHSFVADFGTRLEKYIKDKYPLAKFKMFSDHSPIDEVHAASVSGLGFIGDNGLLINEKYSSFVFIGECVTDLTPKELGLEYAPEAGASECIHCGACALACPSGCISHIGSLPLPKTECLSAITQKKGDLTEGEIDLIIQNGSIWGCDKCQNACPFTKSGAFTPIDYFKRDIITRLDLETLNSLDDDAFSKRPFAWRGRNIILRNVMLYEEKMKKQTT